MKKETQNSPPTEKTSRLTQEYRTLHEVAKALQTSDGIKDMLERVLKIITEFDELKVERKAGIFLADEDKRILRLYFTLGEFTPEFLEREKEVPFGDCLCGRAAASGELLMSDSCFTDLRHERRYSDMTAHGHYIVPLKSRDHLVGIMFLYTAIHPSWYRHSQEVLLSIGGLVADAILQHQSEQQLRENQKTLEKEITVRRQVEKKLVQYRDHLEELVAKRTADLSSTNQRLKQEILERKKAEEELMSFREQLRHLSNHLQSIREEEKTRIAREVHDELGQLLTALKMDLSCLEEELPPGKEELLKKTRGMSRLVDSTVQSVQRIATELRPQILDVLGLCEAIEWQAEEFESRTGIQCRKDCLPKKFNLDRELSTALFRIFQETLTNIARHANATQVQISFKREGDHLVLKVADNGRGIEPQQIEHFNSLGLLGIRERVLHWGGDVIFEGKPGKGTAVTVRIPHPPI